MSECVCVYYTVKTKLLTCQLQLFNIFEYILKKLEDFWRWNSNYWIKVQTWFELQNCFDFSMHAICFFIIYVARFSWDFLAGNWCLGPLCDLTINDAFSSLHSSVRGEYKGSPLHVSSMDDWTSDLHNRSTCQTTGGQVGFFMQLWWLA